MRSAKAELKKARKLSKTAKKAAKLALKKFESAKAADAAQKAKASGGGNPRTRDLQSASQAAKAVIARMSKIRRPKATPSAAASPSPHGEPSVIHANANSNGSSAGMEADS